MDKTTKLPTKLSLALANYFVRSLLGSSRETGCKYVGGVVVERRHSTPVPWNKDKCLEKVSQALPKNWGYSACAGTFWFHKGNSVIEVDAKSWPLGKVTKNKKSATK